MSDVPTIREELDRKTLEALEWIIKREHLGEISRAQAYESIRTIWYLIAGLTSDDVTETVSLAERELWQEPVEMRAYTKEGVDVVLVERNLHKLVLRVIRQKSGLGPNKQPFEATRKEKNFDTPPDLLQAYNKFCDELEEMGYRREA